MPSAVRQRLPVDLCRQGYRKHWNGSSGLVYHIQEIQASPGHYDVFQEDKQHKHQSSRKHFNKSPRKHTNAMDQVIPKSFPRRGSADMGLSDSERKVTFELSSSAKSDIIYPFSCDAYAMESSVAPLPSEVPLPPIEWLQHSTRKSASPVITDRTLREILCCS
uniref:Uncharacterized protein n=1 Tax=Arion vulgaris TaxID=1028688 RepID=A0A0B6YUM8_9EUPU